MNIDSPVIFADGTEFYKKLAVDYIQHDKGLFILAPSGSGKTFFVNNQTTWDWIDGDYLWPATGADLSSDEWGDGDIEMINIKSDIITIQAKNLGFWIIGSSNSFLRPDAIVIPPLEKHIEYISKRETGDYDGGAKSANMEEVMEHRKIILRWGDKGVPCFQSIGAATEFLSRRL